MQSKDFARYLVYGLDRFETRVTLFTVWRFLVRWQDARWADFQLKMYDVKYKVSGE